MNSSKQIKLGALMSYFTIAFNMVAGLLYTPWMISKIGQSNFGLYTLATSVITLFVMDFGMGSAVARFVSKYNAEGDTEKANNFLGIVYKLYFGIDAVILLALVIVGCFTDVIYDNLTPSELETFQVLYIVVGLFSVVSFPFTNLNGILTACEQFVPLKFADLLHKVIIIVMMVIALSMGAGVYALVTVNAIAGLLVIVYKLIILHRYTAMRANLHYRDRAMLKEIFGFSMWTTVGSLAQRLIFNITPSIIAAVSVTGAVGVAVFGLAQTIEGYVYTFATAINGMFMPRISKIIHDGKKEEELVPLMIRIGRIQCMLIGLLTVGFICFGQSFIVDIWRKPDFEASYLCAVFLIIPSFFYLPMQIANTTLIVENKVRLQAFVFVGMGLINVCLSAVLSHYFGALGACISIFVAYMVRTIAMMIIYQKSLKLPMGKFLKEVYLKLTPFLLVAMGLGLALETWNPIPNRILRFLVNGVLFVLMFAGLIYGFAMNTYEKNLLLGLAKKVLKKR